MPRSATLFACSACGHESPKWHGRCPSCGEWNSLVEETRSGPSGRSPSRRGGRALTPLPLAEVEAATVDRLPTGIGELDRVLGGGLVPGSLVLIGGAAGPGQADPPPPRLGERRR